MNPVAGHAVTWLHSSFCQTGECPEIALLEDGKIGLRDSKNPDGPVLVFTWPEWRAFCRSVRSGEFGELTA